MKADTIFLPHALEGDTLRRLMDERDLDLALLPVHGLVCWRTDSGFFSRFGNGWFGESESHPDGSFFIRRRVGEEFTYLLCQTEKGTVLHYREGSNPYFREEILFFEPGDTSWWEIACSWLDRDVSCALSHAVGRETDQRRNGHPLVEVREARWDRWLSQTDIVFEGIPPAILEPFAPSPSSVLLPHRENGSCLRPTFSDDSKEWLLSLYPTEGRGPRLPPIIYPELLKEWLLSPYPTAAELAEDKDLFESLGFDVEITGGRVSFGGASRARLLSLLREPSVARLLSRVGP